MHQAGTQAHRTDLATSWPALLVVCGGHVARTGVVPEAIDLKPGINMPTQEATLWCPAQLSERPPAAISSDRAPVIGSAQGRSAKGDLLA